MRQEEREQYIRMEVLRILRECGSYMLPDTRLHEHLMIKILPPPIASELDAAIKWLDQENFIAGVRPELGGPVKWKLTDKGRASAV